MLLEDLVTVLKIFAPRRNPQQWVAVSIDPTAEGVKRLNEFKQQLPARVPDEARNQSTQPLVQKMRESLGMANVQIYGMPRTTNLAQVMVEADYRMKLIAIGLEPPPVPMSTFIGEVQKAPRDLQRWWLTPAEKCLKQSADQLAAELVGRGVQLKTELLKADGQGNLVWLHHQQRPGKPSRAARRYAESFTEKYEAISEVRPVFAQLRNAMDLLVLGAWLLKNKGYEKSGWRPTTLLDESQVPVSTTVDTRQAPCVANAVWKGRFLVLPAGGGVSVQASNALIQENLVPDTNQKLQAAADKLTIPAGQRWWWD